MTRAPYEPTAGDAEFSGERRKSGNGPQPRTAVLIALETIAPGDDRGCRIAVPLCQCSNVIHRHTTNPGSPLGRVGACSFHVSIEPQNVLLYERLIEPAEPLQLDGKGPGEHHVRPGAYGQMQMGLLGRTQRGRVATALAYKHFGIEAPRQQRPLF